MKKPPLWCTVLVCIVAWTATTGTQEEDNRASLLQALPLAADLPSGYGPVTLGDRGEFYTVGTSQPRLHDGDAHHGLPATVAWAAHPKNEAARRQGLHYRVEGGRVVAAGYLVRQADLVAGHSFYGLTLRELDFPPAHRLTIEYLEGSTETSAGYLFLWNFLPASDQPHPMLHRGELQDLSVLPPTFGIVRNAEHVDDFYPRMGRHHRNLSESVNRLPGATGAESVWYGEAANALIFIEYILGEQDLRDGASWPTLPLDDLPIPPIDNVHILHYNGASAERPGRYTVHMYFVPETQYLAWETEPRVVDATRLR